MNRASRLASGLLLCASLGACVHALPEESVPVGASGGGTQVGAADVDATPPPSEDRRGRRKRGAQRAERVAPTRVTTIGVNAYLWRAALDTLSFMTIAQSDSNGGVITTEWYINPAVPTERMKVSVAILDQDLRADAVRIATSRQVLQGGQWVDTSVQAATNQRLEEIILEKARTLRRNAGAG